MTRPRAGAEAARELYEVQGLSHRKISAKLEIPYGTVAGWCSKRGWRRQIIEPRGVLTPEQVETARMWYEEDGLTMDEIAARLGVSKGVITGHAARAYWVKVGLAERPSRPRIMPEVPVTTLFERMNALEAEMTRVLKETSGNYYYTPRKEVDAEV